MNIVTYSSPVALAPLVYAVGLYKGTQSWENWRANGKGLLQAGAHADEQAAVHEGQQTCALRSLQPTPAQSITVCNGALLRWRHAQLGEVFLQGAGKSTGLPNPYYSLSCCTVTTRSSTAVPPCHYDSRLFFHTESCGGSTQGW